MTRASLLAVCCLVVAWPAAAQAAPDSAAPAPPSRAEMRFELLLEELRAAEAALESDPGNRESALRRLGALYLVGVQEKRAVEAGLRAIDSLPPDPEAADDAMALAYRGAFTVLRGKHAFWPHDKLRHVRHGLDLLDRAVASLPASARIRYLRLMSGYYLPGLFGRGDEVRADFAALADVLPAAAPDFTPRLHREIVQFVLENGRLEAPVSDALRRSIGGS